MRTCFLLQGVNVISQVFPLRHRIFSTKYDLLLQQYTLFLLLMYFYFTTSLTTYKWQHNNIHSSISMHWSVFTQGKSFNDNHCVTTNNIHCSISLHWSVFTHGKWQHNNIHPSISLQSLLLIYVKIPLRNFQSTEIYVQVTQYYARNEPSIISIVTHNVWL